MKKGVLYTGGAIIILVISFIAFVLPSSLSRMGPKQEGLVFGTWDGKKISYEQGSDYTEFLSQYAEMFRNMGQTIDSSNQYNVYNYAFNSTVIKYQQQDALKAAGYEVPQDTINYKLKNYFTDSDGNFLKKAYKQADDATIESLTNSLKDSLYIGRHYDDNFGSTETLGSNKFFGLKQNQAEIDFLNNFGSDKRIFKAAIFNTTNYPVEEQEKFGRANPEKFTKYDLSIITVTDKAVADKVLSRIKKGQLTFSSAVLEYSEKNYSDSEGKLTNNSQYQIENLLKNAEDFAQIASLQKDEFTSPVETLMGYSIFYCDGDKTTPDFSNEETVKDVGNYINIYETSIIEDYYKDIAAKFVKEAKASDFESAAANYEMVTTYELPAFPLNYGSSSLFQAMDTSANTALANVDTNEDFLKAAFALKLNDFSEPVLAGQDIAVLQYIGNADEEAQEPKTFADEINNFDQTSTQSVALESPKLVNNFLTVYFDNFVSNSF